MTTMLTHDLIDTYLGQLTDDGRSPRTTRTYRNTLLIYLDWLDGKPLSAVTPTDVRAFAKRFRPKAPEGAQAATRRRDITTIRLFHQWAHEEGHQVPQVSSVRTPSVSAPRPKPILDDHWRSLWLSDLAPQERLWLGLGYYCGLRRIEIVTIPPEAIGRPQEGQMEFVRKGGSMYPIEYKLMIEAVQQELPWIAERTDEWMDILHETAEHRLDLGADRLWWEAIGDIENDGNRLNKRMAVLERNVGLQDAVTPHRMRHSCATNLLRAGWPVDEVRIALSHSSVDITFRYMDYSGQTARRLSREARGQGHGTRTSTRH